MKSARINLIVIVTNKILYRFSPYTITLYSFCVDISDLFEIKRFFENLRNELSRANNDAT